MVFAQCLHQLKPNNLSFISVNRGQRRCACKAQQYSAINCIDSIMKPLLSMQTDSSSKCPKAQGRLYMHKPGPLNHKRDRPHLVCSNGRHRWFTHITPNQSSFTDCPVTCCCAAILQLG